MVAGMAAKEAVFLPSKIVREREGEGRERVAA